MHSDVFHKRLAAATWFAAVIGAVIFAVTWGSIGYSTGAFRLDIGVSAAPTGVTRLGLPPMGALIAHTHLLPLELSVTLQNVDLEGLRQLVSEKEPTRPELETWLRQEARRALTLLLARLLVLGMLGGALFAWAVGRGVRTIHAWRPRTVARLLLGGAFVGALAISLLVGTTWATYDVNAFAAPSYEGMLEAAPWMITLIQDGLLHVERLGERLQLLGSNLYAVFDRIDSFNPQVLADTDFLLMHISDIHNHVAALQFIDQVAKSFQVDMIVNTGDFTDWGTPLEAELVRPLGPAGVPNLFVSGNHESPEILQRLKEAGVQVIDWDVVEVDGFRIMGVGDPAAHDTSPRTISVAQARQIADEAEKAVEQESKPVDILAVHNHHVGRAITPGSVPVVLFGHNHVAETVQDDGTVYVNAGSTGAAGIRGLESNQEIPFSLALLHFSRKGDRPQLLAVDIIEVTALESGFRMRRRLIQDSAATEGQTENSNPES